MKFTGIYLIWSTLDAMMNHVGTTSVTCVKHPTPTVVGDNRADKKERVSIRLKLPPSWLILGRLLLLGHTIGWEGDIGI